uniref:Uncharacterized protein n=1 Tax=Amphora coffeiformis TaxID=265554 RepID=A0A7S3L3L0_9STRA
MWASETLHALWWHAYVSTSHTNIRRCGRTERGQVIVSKATANYDISNNDLTLPPPFCGTLRHEPLLIYKERRQKQSLVLLSVVCRHVEHNEVATRKATKETKSQAKFANWPPG